tara:strand:- start:162 stop:419 length:258 start_codon:yes stop_codon:yes gene_type:complete
MKIIDIKSEISKSYLLEAFASVYSQKLGKDYNEVLLMLNEKFDQKLNEIGEKITNNDFITKEKAKSLENKDLEEFLKDKTVIKEE